MVGGGNVAFDAARTALRLGAKEVFIVYRRTRDEMPANDEEIEEAEHERIKLLYLVAPTRIVTENGKVKGLECQRMELGDFDASGRRRPVPVKGSEFLLDADTVIPAVGYVPDLSCLPQNDGFKSTRWGTLIVDPITLATHIPGVFAGGDLVIGPSTVVEAMASGYRAAISIDRYLKEQDMYKERYHQALRRAGVPKAEGSEEEGGGREAAGRDARNGRRSPRVHLRGGKPGIRRRDRRARSEAMSALRSGALESYCCRWPGAAPYP